MLVSGLHVHLSWHGAPRRGVKWGHGRRGVLWLFTGHPLSSGGTGPLLNTSTHTRKKNSCHYINMNYSHRKVRFSSTGMPYQMSVDLKTTIIICKCNSNILYWNRYRYKCHWHRQVHAHLQLRIMMPHQKDKRRLKLIHYYIICKGIVYRNHHFFNLERLMEKNKSTSTFQG